MPGIGPYHAASPRNIPLPLAEESRVDPDKTEKKAQYRTDYRRISIRTTDGSTLRGYVNLGVKERVSDLFTKTESQFVVLTECEHSKVQAPVLFINKDHIVWVEPED